MTVRYGRAGDTKQNVNSEIQDPQTISTADLSPSSDDATPAPAADTDDNDIDEPPPETDSEPETATPEVSKLEAPTVTAADFSGAEDNSIGLSLNIASNSSNVNNENIVINVSGVPDGAKLSLGTQLSDGSWNLSPEQIADVALIPAEHSAGVFNLTAKAVAGSVPFFL